jgi:hypothetical protein
VLCTILLALTCVLFIILIYNASLATIDASTMAISTFMADVERHIRHVDLCLDSDMDIDDLPDRLDGIDIIPDMTLLVMSQPSPELNGVYVRTSARVWARILIPYKNEQFRVLRGKIYGNKLVSFVSMNY